MCGIVGMAGDLDHELRTKIFKDMLDACQSRGRDSTGVIRVKPGGEEYTWAKQLGSPAYLYDSKMWDRHIDGASQVLIGHCRHKTSGGTEVKNAHPFDFPEKGIVGVHNGTLQRHHMLDTYHHSKVDSEVLYGHLAENGVEETFKTVEGAYACAWWDNDASTLNFIRNDQRPLWFTWSKDLKTMFWASEIWMFGAVARKKALWDGGESKQVYHEIPPHTLWSFRINHNAKGEERVLNLRPVKEIKPEKKEYTPIHQRNMPLGGNRQAGNGTGAHGSYGHFQNGRWVEGRNSEWVDRGNGTYERSYGPADHPNPSKKTGGEVTDPFAEAKGKLVTFLDGTELELEAQRRSPNLPALTPPDGTSSPISSVEFLRQSVQTSDSSTAESSTKSSQKKKLSLPEKTSNVFPLKSKDEHSEKCPGSHLHSRTEDKSKSGVSFRTVAGIPYITWNATGREFAEEEMMQNVGGCCTFCKKTLMDAAEVADFIDDKRVICTDCLQEPQMDALVRYGEC